MGLEPLKIYLDSCVVIYLVEEHPTFAAATEAFLPANPNLILFVSDLTILECLVLPLRRQNKPIIERFNGWFSNATVLTLPKEVFRNAAQFRADHPSLKTPDALHLATALYHKCHELWTNDERLDVVVPGFVKNLYASASSE